jgi:hypothetical protein
MADERVVPMRDSVLAVTKLSLVGLAGLGVQALCHPLRLRRTGYDDDLSEWGGSGLTDITCVCYCA